MRAILPLALLAVVGCYSPRPVEPTPSSWSYGGGYGADAGPDAGPLEATVYYDEYSGYASFNVSRDAHVSLFLLRPGAGLEMIYPAIGYGTGTSFRQGRHMVRTASAFHRTSRTSMWDNDMWGRDFENGPMYVLLVASDEPLEVNQFLATRTMGWLRHSSVTYSPFLALEALVGDIVPNPTTSAWTTAMHVVWPRDNYRDRDRYERQRYTRVRCANGVVLLVPTDLVLAGYPVCPEHFQRPQPDSAADSTGARYRKVAPRRPATAQGWMTASVDGVDLRRELDRLREENGKRELGPLTTRPFAEREIERRRVGPTWDDDFPPRGTRAGIDRPGTNNGPGARPAPSRPDARPAPSRPTTRPAPSRPETRPAPSRPEARPAPTRPEARPAPSQPATRPAPARPAPPPRPKPKPTNGGGGGGGG